MSTDHQKYSIANQRKAIAEYAENRSFTIVRTYADEGKSGLSFEGRGALKQLIADVVSGATNFGTILVYDVSRWGRFQDNDESAYYEFICKKAGVRIRYCAEPFENDESLTSSILKSMKRAMASEFSRELSKKTFFTQSRIVKLGYRAGGSVPFGMRRLLVDSTGVPITQLERGQRKAVHGDRVILIPGPPQDVKTVRRIFHHYVHGGKSPGKIAELLNAARVPNPSGKPWMYHFIRYILMNEVYIGNNVYNRNSHKLRGRKVSNPPAQWVRGAAVFKPIVSVELFESAKRLLYERRKHPADEMLDRLRTLFQRKGHLSAQLINATAGMRKSYSYGRRFGGLRRAYSLVGYTDPSRFKAYATGEVTRALLKSVIAQVAKHVVAAGGSIRIDTQHFHIVVNDTIKISVASARCGRMWYDSQLSWDAHVGRTTTRPDYAIIARLAEGNRSILDYYFLPRSEMKAKTMKKGSETWLLTNRNRAHMETYRHESLDFVVDFVTKGCKSCLCF